HPRLRARYAASVRGYNATSISIAVAPLQLDYGYDWRPRERFYGTGMGASRLKLGGFASQTELARASLRFGWKKSAIDSLPRTTVTVWAGPRSAITTRGRQPGVPSVAVLFPALGQATLDRRVDHLVSGARLAIDRRDGEPHWTHGWRGLLQG